MPNNSPLPENQFFEQPQAGAVLAFDFGKKRIGVAVGNTAVKVAHPLVTVDSEVTERRFALIGQLIQTWQPVLLIVGLPLHSDGTAHELTQLSQRFARRLSGRFNIRVIMKDERYTSEIASTSLREAGVAGRKQKAVLDQVAAQQILQSFFDEPHATA
jgi:putative Holliday junction resolvase